MSEETAAAEETVLQDRRESVLFVTLNRPEALNAWTPELARSLFAALRTAEREASIRVVVVTGAGRAFCAGEDVGEADRRAAVPGPVPLGDALKSGLGRVVSQVRRMEKPVIAAINGTAAGPGASLAMACDVRVCSATAKLVPDFVETGTVPEGGLARPLLLTMGRSLASEHVWTGKPITARQAEHFGLVSEVVASDELEKTTRFLAEKLAKAPPAAVGLSKRLFNRAAGDLEEQLEYEAKLQDILGRTKDHREGVAARREKRQPKFTGE